MRKKVKQFFKFQPFSQKQRKELVVLDITGKRCRGYHRRRRDPIWKDGEHVTIFRYVGDEQFQRTKLCNVWKDDRLLPT